MKIIVVHLMLLALLKWDALSSTLKGEKENGVIYGVISEDVQSNQEVILTPPISSGDLSHDVCEYKLEPSSKDVNNENQGEVQLPTVIPFRVELQDKKTGSAILLVEDGSKLDYEMVNNYHLDMITIFCDKNVTPTRREMSIRVSDVNEFPPEWKEKGYLVEVSEGKMYDPLLKMAAVDRDGSVKFSSICAYKLVTADVPFALDKNGFLRNTKPLDYDSRHNYILEVVAEDCGGLVSDKVFVNILIKEKCQAGWKGLKKEVNYKLSSLRPSLLFPSNSASLEFCRMDNCTLEQITVSLRLWKVNDSVDMNNIIISGNTESDLNNDVMTAEVDRNCELDQNSIERRFKTCETSLKTVDLLTSEITNVEEPLKNNGVLFDGKSVKFDIPTHKVKNHEPDEEEENSDDDIDVEKKKGVESFVMTKDGPNSRFAVSMWLKRSYDEALGSDNKDEKQSVVCSSDAEGMSRNHISIFLHNCHLVAMARFEPSGRHLTDVKRKTPELEKERNEDDEFYRHSEWHWKLNQVCDSNWHHYAVNVDQDKARLFVDGNLFIDTRHNPVIIDDHALHLSKKVNSTKLTVGACWKGSTQTYGDFLRGRLAGLKILRRSLFNEQTIRCINNCNEKLDFHSINEMESGMSISMNSQMTELVINGKTKASVEHLLSRVGYVNPHANMPLSSANNWTSSELSPLSLSLSTVIALQTSIKCSEDAQQRTLSSESIKIHMIPNDASADDDDDDDDDDVKRQGPLYSRYLSIRGTQRREYEEGDIQNGVQLFKGINIYLHEQQEEDDNHFNEVNSCTVAVSPSLIDGLDDLQYSPALARKRRLVVNFSLDGLLIEGPATVDDFSEFLKFIYYTHQKPETLNRKTFSVFCYDRYGRRSKNELNVQMSVIHFDYSDDILHQPDHAAHDRFLHSMPKGPQKDGGLAGNVSVIVTITLCICVLMVVISVGMYRVFFHRQKTVRVHVDNHQDIQWDESTITITVNPLETTALKEEEQDEKAGEELAGVHETSVNDYYYDDDDDIGSAHEMMRDTDDDDEDNKGDEDASKINHFVISDTE